MSSPDERRRAGAAVSRRIVDLQTTPAAVARRAGVDPRTLRALITGTRWPRQSVRDRINTALHWPPGEIAARSSLREELQKFSSRELLEELCRRADEVPPDGTGFLDEL